MKKKVLKGCLNLEFKFRIGIKGTKYLFTKYSKAILKVMENFEHMIKTLQAIH